MTSYKQIIDYFDKHQTFLSFLLLIPTILIFVFMFKSGAPFCCDANSYLNTMIGYQSEGLFFHHGATGYRGYMFPYLYSLLPIDYTSSLLLGGITIPTYSMASIFFFLSIEFYIIKQLLKNKNLTLFYLSIFINPLALVYIPYPLQESFIILLFSLFVPLIFITYMQKKKILLIILLGLFLGSMYMARASQALLVLPILIFALFIIFKSKEMNINKIKLLITFICSSILFIIPQSLITQKYLNTINPYPATALLSQQFNWGNMYAKYGTNLSVNLCTGKIEDFRNPLLTNLKPKNNKNLYVNSHTGIAQVYWNPLACSIKDIKNQENRKNIIIECNENNQEPVKGFTSLVQNNTLDQLFFKSIIHVFSILNYDYLYPYVKDYKTKLFTWHQILSMLIVFFGFYNILKKYWSRNFNAFDVFLDSILFITLGTVMFFSVETRFGLLSTIILSINAANLFISHKPKGYELLSLVFSAVLFVLVSSLLSLYILSFSGALST